MALDIGKQIAELKQMTVRELREKYEAVFGEPTRAGNKDVLFKRIAWRIQSRESRRSPWRNSWRNSHGAAFVRRHRMRLSSSELSCSSPTILLAGRVCISSGPRWPEPAGQRAGREAKVVVGIIRLESADGQIPRSFRSHRSG